jgi:hypothetical protein
MKNIFFGAVLIIFLAGCKSSIGKNKNFKITSDKLVSADLLSNFSQQEIKKPNGSNLPKPKKPDSQKYYTKILHISHISPEEMAFIKEIENIK